MKVRSAIACAAGKLTYLVLHKALKRDASQLPGRVCLAIDPKALAHLRDKASQGSMVVCGTNGKTTTTNLVASAIESSGRRVLCNRTGANMLAGATSALLAKGTADWAVIEADELSARHIISQLRPNYLVLLNLFRDQLDRAGEIDHIQDTIVSALEASPNTTLLTCGDDPLTWSVALRAKRAGTRVLSFGVGGDLGAAPDRVPEARFCQVCGEELTYAYRTYAQLGAYQCPACDFGRPELDFVASNARVDAEHVSLTMARKDKGDTMGLHLDTGGAYMTYNLLAAAAAASLLDIGEKDLQRALSRFHPYNGRQERFTIDGREVVLNLAKNPAGFNQSISLMLADPRPKAAFVVVNDNPNDGRDVSWIWDVDFERLAERADMRTIVAGGLRACDVRVRLKYAGISPALAESVREALSLVSCEPKECVFYALVNYSALAPTREELARIGGTGRANATHPHHARKEKR